MLFFGVGLLCLLQSGVKEIKSELDGHLREQRKRLGCSDAEFWHSAKEKYQIQVPERYFSKNRQVRVDAVVRSRRQMCNAVSSVKPHVAELATPG